MGAWAKRDRWPIRSALAVGTLTLCAVVVGMWGCSGNPDHKKSSTGLPKPSGGQALVTRLSGEWVKTDTPTTTLYFTKASNKMVYSFKERVKLPGGSRLDPPVYTGEERQNSRTFDFQVAGDKAIKFKAPLGDVLIELEFTSDEEFMAIYKSEWNNELKVQGQFRRKNAGVAKTPSNDAQSRIDRFEQKRERLQALLEKATLDQKGVVQKLKNAGVKTPADLKGNPQGQRLAELLQKVTMEIDGLERQITTLDAAILDAKAIARRLERDKVGISEDEMEKLGLQLRELEERTDGVSARPTTPLDIEAAFQRAMKKQK